MVDLNLHEVSNRVKDMLNIPTAPEGVVKTYRTDTGKSIKIELFMEDVYINPDGSISVIDRLSNIQDGTYTGLDIKNGKLVGFVNIPQCIYTPTSILSPAGDHRIPYHEQQWYWKVINKLWEIAKFLLFKTPKWLITHGWDLIKLIIFFIWTIIKFIVWSVPKWFFKDVVGGIILWLWEHIVERLLLPLLDDEYARLVVGFMDWIKEKSQAIWDWIYSEGYDMVMSGIRKDGVKSTHATSSKKALPDNGLVGKVIDLVTDSPRAFKATIENVGDNVGGGVENISTFSGWLGNAGKFVTDIFAIPANITNPGILNKNIDMKPTISPLPKNEGSGRLTAESMKAWRAGTL